MHPASSASPSSSRWRLCLTLFLTLATWLVVMPLHPVKAELFEGSYLFPDQEPLPLPSSSSSTPFTSTTSTTANTVTSATLIASSQSSALASQSESSTVIATSTSSLISVTTSLPPLSVPTSSDPTVSTVDPPTTSTAVATGGTGATVSVDPTSVATQPIPTDAFEYAPPAKGKGMGKSAPPPPELDPAPVPPAPGTGDDAAADMIDNDYGINAHAPHVPFTPHIDPQVETPMSHFHPAFGAAIPPRPKCKPRKQASPLTTTTTATAYATKEGSGTKATYEKRQAPPPPPSGGPAPPRQPRNDMERVEFYFGQRLDTNLARLPAESQFAPTPWAASYWPTFRDSLNARWAPNELPPSDKYARAFGLNVAQFRDSVSRHNGIQAHSHRRPCATNQDCRTLSDGSVCAKRDGEARGFCIPTWFGICHAWAPAAVMEPEPRCPVTKNGVTFRAFDIKALVTLLWDGARTPTVFTGNRYNGPEEAPRDQFGRFRDANYRDLNPGFMHILMANMLGRFRKSFVVDVTGSAEVWNQPVKGYKVLEQTLMTPAAAAQRFFNSPTYVFNPRAVMVASVKTRFTWVVESGEDGPLVSTGRINQYLDSRDYTYLLELDARQNIIGGEWVGASIADHPDFAWFPAQRPAMDTVTRVGLTYRHVRELLNESARPQC